MTLNINELMRGGTCMLSKAGLAVGGTASKARINNPTTTAFTTWAINGLTYTIADADNGIILSGDEQADLSTCLYTVCISTAGAGTVVQGEVELTADVTAGKVALDWPAPTVDTCPVGGIKVVTSGGVFTPGTTSLGTLNTATYYDFFCIPTGPITS